ncbi:50S ribosomal protein L15 [Candidatus Adlerbacteria bacterium RIFCSPHIGHO2_01_FULL_54_23]|uniref:Large ribosomal subunit protein uL15 n=3 Tax=Candidatus Adleribacteriota TaxID=1752736 RepID=A0A1F4Y0F4_9BACT|nr:MAG: 50S ribosomal protein L15 [Candidatus Adlerbacteria bacterium GW2011_GWA1_54_10]KKW36173.1 MAG: 50S ribosomal protein L15 [Candidatus Adlerbacteria bacterium GW2011_GWA2_54_12]KKW37373.1 MAG: 50S ribosomal protein L15 [Candidatus Adlerbacteria bacterium GW2011_GWB1_54_7]OGC79007.1 MAG: 50S ribosomal protein L15 [Candidatus Adlerbacteria bacterium RIFCSPHIGHO2_01_FULL_54_23]OGC87447.1 MAG: 50S ribosomal protein L15 [Candidatus Adlerbacteria bacterium RIFCSPLOWO2_01_FULL_54_16]
MQLHELKPKTGRKTSKRIGRGRASGKGKTSGRGTKGQKARAGHHIRPDVREKIKKLPKLRGYRVRRIAKAAAVVNVGVLEKFFDSGAAVSPKILAERGLIRARKGSVPAVKILGDGDITKNLSVSDCAVSPKARAKIEKAGGSIR